MLINVAVYPWPSLLACCCDCDSGSGQTVGNVCLFQMYMSTESMTVFKFMGQGGGGVVLQKIVERLPKLMDTWPMGHVFLPGRVFLRSAVSLGPW